MLECFGFFLRLFFVGKVGDLAGKLALVLDHLEVQGMEKDVFAAGCLIVIEASFIVFLNFRLLCADCLLVDLLSTQFLWRHKTRLFFIVGLSIFIRLLKLRFTVFNCLSDKWKQVFFFGSLKFNVVLIK